MAEDYAELIAGLRRQALFGDELAKKAVTAIHALLAENARLREKADLYDAMDSASRDLPI